MAVKTSKLTCDDCRFCLLDDYGYSNYTTEGIYVHCLLNKHPESGFDQFYGEDKRMQFADQCDAFTAGGPIHLDTDRENAKVSPDGIVDYSSYAGDVPRLILMNAWAAKYNR